VGEQHRFKVGQTLTIGGLRGVVTDASSAPDGMTEKVSVDIISPRPDPGGPPPDRLPSREDMDAVRKIVGSRGDRWKGPEPKKKKREWRRLR